MIIHKHHIKPRYAGGTDKPENILEVSVNEHAELHHQLWLEKGNWQDYLAWKGLSGRIGREEIIQFKNKMAHLGKSPWNKGIKGKDSHFYGIKQSKEWIAKRSNNFKKSYFITTPTGENIIITGLNEFCRKINLNPQNMIKVAQGKRTHHKHYICNFIKSDNTT